jgi:hypothetical protein
MGNKIQFITCNRVKDYYGITSGLFNSASFVVNFLNNNDFNAVINPVIDSNGIDKVVTEFDPDVVIIEALWVPPAKFRELLTIPRHSKRKWVVRVHSKAPFLANEGLATEWISEYTRIYDGRITIAPNANELTRQFTTAFPNGDFTTLLNVYEPECQFQTKPIKKNESDSIDIGCFGAVRPLKNNYQQALAAISFAESIGKKLRFHMNTSRMEQSGDNVMKNIRELFKNSNNELIEHPWYKHKEFLDAISKMDIGMQVSFSESFNIVTADFVNVGVPIVISDDIEWMPWILKASPTSHEEMVRKLKIARMFPRETRFFQTLALNNYNKRAKRTWLKFLESVIN